MADPSFNEGYVSVPVWTQVSAPTVSSVIYSDSSNRMLLKQGAKVLTFDLTNLASTATFSVPDFSTSGTISRFGCGPIAVMIMSPASMASRLPSSVAGRGRAAAHCPGLRTRAGAALDRGRRAVDSGHGARACVTGFLPSHHDVVCVLVLVLACRLCGGGGGFDIFRQFHFR